MFNSHAKQQKFTVHRILDIKKIFLLILFSTLLAFTLSTLHAEPFGIHVEPSTERTTFLSQNGITWEFENEVEYGQFVNGDWWIVGPVTVNSVSPEPNTVDGVSINGSMINPVRDQAYDSRAQGYNADLEVNFPITIDYEASLCSTISRELRLSEPLRPAVQTGAVLTVLLEKPPENSFRPGIIGSTKTLYNADDIDWNLLPNLSVPSGTSPRGVKDMNKELDGPRFLHNLSSWSGYIIPKDSVWSNYHGNIALDLAEAATLIISDAEQGTAEKSKLVEYYIQLGIDYYSFQLYCKGGAGEYNYFFPIVFTGLMLGEEDMSRLFAEGRNEKPDYYQEMVGSKPRLYYGIETEQVRSSILPVRNVADTIWLGGDTPYGQDTWSGYWARTGRNPARYNTGLGHEQLHPDEWDEYAPKYSYKNLHSRYVVGFTIAAWAMSALDLIGNDAYVPYAIRWMYETDDIVTDSHATIPDHTPYAYGGTSFIQGMWEEYGNNITNDYY